MILWLISTIDIISRIIILLIIIHVVLTYFVSPFHPIRQWIDRIVEPILSPIRRIIPSVGMIDFSPLVLILLVQIVTMFIKNLLRSLL